MKKNSLLDNKGMTIMEVLISVCIISIVLILLFSLLIQVRSEDRDNSIQSNFILHQSVITKAIEEDIIDYGLYSISECNASEVVEDPETMKDSTNAKCVQFTYGTSDENDSFTNNVGFLLLYKYILRYTLDENGKYVEDKTVSNSAPWMIAYRRGYYKPDKIYIGKSISDDVSVNKFIESTSTMKELPADIKFDKDPYVRYTSGAGYNSGLLVLPITTEEDEHYDIDISFIYNIDNSKKQSNFSCYYINDTFCNDLSNDLSNGSTLKNKEYKLYLVDKTNEEDTKYFLGWRTYPYFLSENEIINKSKKDAERFLENVKSYNFDTKVEDYTITIGVTNK